VTKENPLCNGNIHAFESHSYMISKLGSDFVPFGHSNECKFEIFQYGTKKIFGTQFHPEMSPDGKLLLKKFSLV
jgi:GMP synthase (glutamine-hydrolysing)